jgi:ribosomal protein S18 acetylase RimI-like enzyme
MEKKLKDFLKSERSNAWLESREMSVYVRKGHHLGMNGELRSYFDIASIEVKPNFQRQGIFKRFLDLCQHL